MQPMMSLVLPTFTNTWNISTRQQSHLPFDRNYIGGLYKNKCYHVMTYYTLYVIICPILTTCPIQWLCSSLSWKYLGQKDLSGVGLVWVYHWNWNVDGVPMSRVNVRECPALNWNLFWKVEYCPTTVRFILDNTLQSIHYWSCCSRDLSNPVKKGQLIFQDVTRTKVLLVRLYQLIL